jgi:integrase/recombinase XerD
VNLVREAASSLAALVPEHLRALRARGYAASTVGDRRRHLRDFTTWLEDRGITRPAQVTLSVIERYRVHLYERRKADGSPLGWGSQALHLTAVKGLFKWLTRQHHVASNPAAELELPRLPKRIPRTVLTAREVELVLEQPDLSEPMGMRDRAILELLYSTGIRRAECCGLVLTDVDLARLVVLVREGKGARDRYVPLGERAALWLDRYLTNVRPRYVTPPDEGNSGNLGRLFLTKRGRGLTPKRLGALVSGYLDAAAIGKRGSCHVFRHTMATLMLEGGADVRHIQEILGHADLSTTALYTHLSIAQLQDVHRRTHPARMKRRTDEP